MRILTIQSKELDARQITYADPSKCNHTNALPAYHHLFADYNKKKGTNYTAFFWGFSELLVDGLDKQIKRACEMINSTGETKALVLEVPDHLCLETDFYNFSDEIYASEFPYELESVWELIYENRNSEKQVIFPYIDKSMVIMEIEIKKGENHAV